jgi:hypothetical protein
LAKETNKHGERRNKEEDRERTGCQEGEIHGQKEGDERQEVCSRHEPRLFTTHLINISRPRAK